MHLILQKKNQEVLKTRSIRIMGQKLLLYQLGRIQVKSMSYYATGLQIRIFRRQFWTANSEYKAGLGLSQPLFEIYRGYMKIETVKKLINKEEIVTMDRQRLSTETLLVF